MAHHIPGRTRLRLAPAHRSPAVVAAVKAALEDVPGVHRVDVSAGAGSVVVHHDPAVTRLEDVADALDARTELVMMLVPPREREWVRHEVSTVAHHVRAGFRALDVRVGQATGGWVDLKMLTPVVFIGAAAVQVTLTEGGWTAVPPYVLLYYAFDTYMKFHELVPHHPALPLSAPAATAPGLGG